MRFLVAGSDTLSGHAIVTALRCEGFDVLELEQAGGQYAEAAAQVMREARPELIINAFEPDQIYDEADGEGIAPRVLAALEYARDQDIPLIQLSTCAVFDGTSKTPYRPTERPNPTTLAGACSLRIEQWIRQHLTRALVLRLGWIIGREPQDLLERVLEAWRERRPVNFSDQHRGNPTAPEDVARVVKAVAKQVLCDAWAWGVYHYAGAETISQLAFARALAEYLMAPDEVADLIGQASPETIAQMREPLNLALNCVDIRDNFGIKQHPWRNYLPALAERLMQQSAKPRSNKVSQVESAGAGL